MLLQDCFTGKSYLSQIFSLCPLLTEIMHIGPETQYYACTLLLIYYHILALTPSRGQGNFLIAQFRRESIPHVVKPLL
jgi:hypothetical protein